MKHIMKQILILFCLCLFAFTSAAQIIGQGKITFEKKTNAKMEMQIEQGDNEWVRSMIDKMAVFKVSEYTLNFNQEQSLYQYDKEIEQKGVNFFGGSGVANKNKVWTQFSKNKVESEKNVYEENFLITDSIAHYNWKIEDEMRTVAGYSCRKAITKIDDSVVVIAFYTNEIMVSGGPEGINGLPGMILGLAIPRLYTTWFATNVELGPQIIEPIKAGRRTKKVNREEFLSELRKGTKDWGKYGVKALWWAML